MRAVLIDPFSQSIDEIDFDNSNFKNIYKLLQIGDRPFTVFSMSPTYHCYLDDEGLLLPPDEQSCWHWAPYNGTLSGRALVLGKVDINGDDTPLQATLKEIKDFVVWRPDIYCSHFKILEGKQKHPVLGLVTTISRVPVFVSRKKAN